MQRFSALLLLAAARVWAQTPIVSGLHTVSIHIDSPQTYNTLLRFFGRDLGWPVLYGAPWPTDRSRSYAGIWAGNVVLEICGPYAGETFPDGVRARLHGLTFRPYESADHSLGGLDRASIRHKPPFGKAEGGLRFVVLDDPALTSPTLAVSIMQGGDPDRESAERDAARARLAANHGGPLGLKSVKEVQVAYPDDASLAKWREFLAPGLQGAGAGPDLHFVTGPRGALAALVVRVASAVTATAFLGSIGSDGTLTSGVKILCTE